MKILMILGGCVIACAALLLTGIYAAILATHIFQAKEENF